MTIASRWSHRRNRTATISIILIMLNYMKLILMHFLWWFHLVGARLAFDLDCVGFRVVSGRRQDQPQKKMIRFHFLQSMWCCCCFAVVCVSESRSGSWINGWSTYFAYAQGSFGKLNRIGKLQIGTSYRFNRWPEVWLCLWFSILIG